MQVRPLQAVDPRVGEGKLLFVRFRSFVLPQTAPNAIRLMLAILQAATALKGDTSAGQAITLATVDATVERSLAEKFDVGGFPTIKIFEKNSATSPSEYEGPREAEGIVSFLKVHLL